MTRSHLPNLLGVGLLALSVALLGGCARKPAGVILGPKPAVYAGERAYESQIVDNIRTWLQSLNPQNAETLRQTGQVVFQYEQLKQSDPAHAQMVEEFTRMSEARIRQSGGIEKLKARGFPAPDFTIQSVSFVAVPSAQGKAAPGAYELTIRYRVGFSNLTLSDPL